MQIELGKKAAGKNEIKWITAIFMFLFHVGSVVALFFFRGRLSSWRSSCIGFREASGSGWDITGC